MVQIKLIVEGGAMQPGPVLAQKIGPLGLNIGKVIQQVNEATKDFKGIKVPIELEINPSTKNIDIKVFSPPVAELLKKELGIQKGSGIQKKFNVANASIEQIISIAKTKQKDLLCKDLKSAVKTIIGTCVSLGILVENKPASEVEKLIDEGKFDKEISQSKTITDPDKIKKMDEFFSNLKKKQDKAIQDQLKAEEAAKSAAISATGSSAGVVGGAASVPADTKLLKEKSKETKPDKKEDKSKVKK